MHERQQRGKGKCSTEAGDSEHPHMESSPEITDAIKADILDSIPGAITFLNIQHRILWSNRATSESLGLDRGQIVGHCCHELWD